MTDYHRRTTCRGCGSSDLVEVLDLGDMPPANACIRLEDIAEERRYPLTVAFCKECSLAQVPDVVDPAILFNKNYKYASGTSPPLVEHFRKYAEDTVLPLVSKTDLVVDVGGNDGTLLNFINTRCRTLNVDPAASKLTGLTPSVALPFSSEVAERIRDQIGQAKVITANNVLAHVDDVVDFVDGVHDLLADDGTFIFEVQWAKNLLDDASYDHVYHEHLCYFSHHSLARLLTQAGLFIVDIDVVETQGRSLRVFANKDGTLRRDNKIHRIMAEERDCGVGKEVAWHTFAKRSQNHRDILRDLVYDLNDGGARIIGYGCPAKASTLLNYCGIGQGDLYYLTDSTPAKQGLYTPGTHIPILSPDDLRDDNPDYALLLSWNYAEHILEKERDLRSRGTKFIVPFPEIRIV